MPWNYPDTSDNGRLITEFGEHGWALVDKKISAERFAEACAMGIKLANKANVYRVACAIIYANRVYFGMSNHGLKKTELPKALQEAMRTKSAESHSPVNCAEIRAMADVVSAGYNPNFFGVGLEVHACRTDDATPYPICDNCKMFLVGSTCTSGGGS
jgi:hypothetical protein